MKRLMGSIGIVAFAMIATGIGIGRRSRRGGHRPWTMHRSTSLAIGLVMLFLAAADVSARVVEIADCAGVASSATAVRYVLTGDADCTDQPGAVLEMARGSSLYLREHTLTGVGVLCFGDCKIYGPGTISRGGVVGNDRVVIVRATIADSKSHGVLASNARGRGRVAVIDSTITGSALNGIECDRKATIFRSNVTGNGRHGVAVGLLSDNGCARSRIRAWSSTLTGNGVYGDCGVTEVCADMTTCDGHSIQMRYSSCDKSYELGSGMPGRSCGACTFD